MTNEQLRAFIAVVEQGSFRKAAEHIFKTQAAVSAAVKSLEDKYDIQLFDRSRYRPELTDAGHAFYHHAKLTMEHFNRLDNIGHQLTQGIESRFNIVISLVFPLPELLSEVKKVVTSFPQTQFKVFTESLNGVVERIDNESADIAFGPDIGLNTCHEKYPIGEVNFVNVAAPGFFNKPSDKGISLEEARGYSQIIVRDSAQQVQKASFFTTDSRESWSVNDFAAKKELLLAGFGWGSMPEHLIAEELASGLLVNIHVEGIPARVSGPLYMFRERNHKRGPVATKLWDELIKVYSE